MTDVPIQTAFEREKDNSQSCFERSRSAFGQHTGGDLPDLTKTSSFMAGGAFWNMNILCNFVLRATVVMFMEP